MIRSALSRIRKLGFFYSGLIVLWLALLVFVLPRYLGGGEASEERAKEAQYLYRTYEGMRFKIPMKYVVSSGTPTFSPLQMGVDRWDDRAWAFLWIPLKDLGIDVPEVSGKRNEDYSGQFGYMSLTIPGMYTFAGSAYGLIARLNAKNCPDWDVRREPTTGLYRIECMGTISSYGLVTENHIEEENAASVFIASCSGDGYKKPAEIAPLIDECWFHPKYKNRLGLDVYINLYFMPQREEIMRRLNALLDSWRVPDDSP